MKYPAFTRGVFAYYERGLNFGERSRPFDRRAAEKFRSALAYFAEIWYNHGMNDNVSEKEKENAEPDGAKRDDGTKNARTEKKARRAAARAEKRRANMRKHVVICPHCGKEALDHMTECPFCRGALIPTGYRAPDRAKLKKIRTATFAIGTVVAIALIVLILVKRG